MDIQLYLRGIKADIGDQMEFVRNFKRTIQFSDLENPTKVTTDYSYSINLPGTDNNKRIFAYVDSLGTDLDAWNPGIPYEFILNVNGALWLHGNYQLTKVGMGKGVTTFTCSFYSMEHEMIVRLGSKTLKEISLFSEQDYFYHYLDRESMADFWGGTHNYADTIRYVPTRSGFYSDFQNDKIMTGKWNTGTEPATLNGYQVIDIGTDIDEYASREYRIEYQRPAVSVDKIMKGIAADNGISVDASLMDSPYVKSGWMLCNQFNIEASEDNILGTIRDYKMSDIHVFGQFASPGFNLPGMSQLTAADTSVFRGSRIVPGNDCRYVTMEVAVRLSMQTHWSNPNLYMSSLVMQYPSADCSVNISGGGYTIWASPNPPTFPTKTDDGRTCIWVDTVSGTATTRNYVYQNYTLKDTYPGWSDCGWTPMKMTFPLTTGVHSGVQFMPMFSFRHLAGDFSDMYPSPSGNIHKTADTFSIEVIPIDELNSGDLTRAKAKGFSGNALTYGAASESWSPLYVNMNSILSNTEMSQRDFLMDFTKMTGCIWDYSGGHVSIVSRNHYFEGYQILDWTGKLDRSGNIELKPITYDKLTYTLGYKNGESFLEKQFNERTGLDYGKQYINTGYGFNTDSEALYDNFAYNTVMSKGERVAYYLQFTNLENKVVRRSMEPYEIPMIEQNDHGKPKEGPRYVFDCGLTSLQKAEEVYITQDSSWMRSDDIGGKCWMDCWNYSGYPAIANNIAICNKIPVFSKHKGDAAFDWAKPMISYSGETDNSYPERIALYPRFWSNYLEELYDAKNRIMTADFYLSTMDLLNFSFKNFVIIDNKLWHPNRIIDYDISGENLTRVELVEVHNLEAYVNGQNWLFEKQ